MSELPSTHGKATVMLWNVRITVGFDIVPPDPDEFLPEDYVCCYALVGGVNVSDMIDEIPHGWQQIADLIARAVKEDF